MKLNWLIIFTAICNIGYSQNLQQKYLTVFFMSEFNYDSLHIFVNKKEVNRVMLYTDPSTGVCDQMVLIPMSSTKRVLTILEINGKKRFESVIQKDSSYLYIFKQPDGKYLFDFSNKLILSE